MDEAVRHKLAVALYGDEAADYLDAPRLDALLPVVREIAAEELREAADEGFSRSTYYRIAYSWLRDRADALTKPPDGPVR